MDIYLDRLPNHAFRHRKLKQGSQYFLTLRGVNIVTAGGITVEPVYVPLVAIDRIGSLIFIEIAWVKPLLLVVIFPTWPFLYFQRTDRIDLNN